MRVLVVNATLAALLASQNGGTLPDGYVLNERVPFLPAPPAPRIVQREPGISPRNQRRLLKKRIK